MSLGERIKNQRNQSGLSQEKVAELVGVGFFIACILSSIENK